MRVLRLTTTGEDQTPHETDIPVLGTTPSSSLEKKRGGVCICKTMSEKAARWLLDYRKYIRWRQEQEEMTKDDQ